MKQAISSLILTLFLITSVHAQNFFFDPNPQVDSVNYATNDNLCLSCNGNANSSAYPVMRYAAISATALELFTALTPEMYGAIANDTIPDDNAIKAVITAGASTGRTILFNPSRLYIAKKQIVINLPIRVKVKVYAVGATLKMMNLSQYSMIYIAFPANSYTDGNGSSITWVGGTIDGNQYNQKWPQNPHGGVYDSYSLPEGVGNGKWWEEDHGSLILVDWARNATFNGVTVLNSVVDGISIRKSYIGTISDCVATGGAPLQYRFVHEQGTYFKVTRSAYKYAYFMNLRAIGAAIGVQMSFENNLAFDTTTLCVIRNSYFENNDQNAIHIEDCAKTFIDSVTVKFDTGRSLYPQMLFSNRSKIVSVTNSSFTNQRLDFSTAANLRVGLVKNCQFKTTIPANAATKLDFFIGGGATHVWNSSFEGITATDLVKSFYVGKCSFKNYGANNYAVTGCYMVDNTRCENGGKTFNFRGGQTARCYNNTYVGIPTSQQKPNFTPPANWFRPWLTYIKIKTKTRITLIQTRDDINTLQ